MKKQIIAATLMASMVLAVGYSNGTNVKVTTHEGKVVEAKAEYSDETTGADGSLLLLNGRKVNRDTVVRDLYIEQDFVVLKNSLGEKVFSFGNDDETTVQVHGYALPEGFEATSVVVCGENATVGRTGIWVGEKASVSGLKRAISGTPILETDNYLAYDCGGIRVGIYLYNDRVSQITYFFN